MQAFIYDLAGLLFPTAASRLFLVVGALVRRESKFPRPTCRGLASTPSPSLLRLASLRVSFAAARPCPSQEHFRCVGERLVVLLLMDSLDLDAGLDLGSFSVPPPSDDLSPLFLNEEIDSIDEQWWQQLALPCNDVEEFCSDPPSGGDTGSAAVAAPSSSCSSPTPTFTSEPDVAVAPSSSGSKRIAEYSPESDQDDPKRARRLEKNREAASQSRARKKSYMKELEVKCRMLEAHVAQLQRVMTMTSAENMALKDELVRVKKPKDSVKNGVAEPAVLESNSLPSEFLRHCSCHSPMGQQVPSRAAGQFQKFLLALLQLLMLAAVNGSSGRQTNLSLSLRDVRSSVPMGMELDRALEGGMVAGRSSRRRKKSRQQYDSNFRWRSPSSGRKALRGNRRKVKHLRSSRIL